MEPSKTSNHPTFSRARNQPPSSTSRPEPTLSRAPRFFAKLIRPLQKKRTRRTTAHKNTQRQNAILRGIAEGSNAQPEYRATQDASMFAPVTEQIDGQASQAPQASSVAQPAENLTRAFADRNELPNISNQLAGLSLGKKVMSMLKPRSSARRTDNSIWRKEGDDAHLGVRISRPVPLSELRARDPTQLPSTYGRGSALISEKQNNVVKDSECLKEENANSNGKGNKVPGDRSEYHGERPKIRQVRRHPFHRNLPSGMAQKSTSRSGDKAIWSSELHKTGTLPQVSRPFATSELRERKVMDRTRLDPEPSELKNTSNRYEREGPSKN